MKRTALNVLALALGILGVMVVAPGLASAHDPHEIAAPPIREAKARVLVPSCEDAYRMVRGQGSSCRVGHGLWKVRLSDGSTLLTHGADAAPGGTGQSGKISPDVRSRQPVCATSGYHRAVIALPSDVVGDKTVASFRSDINVANGIFFHAAVESGSSNGAHLKFLCDTDGQVHVDVVRLRTARAPATFSTIVNDLKALGFGSASEKYAIYYDAKTASGSCGQGDLSVDATDAGTNRNNSGGTYALVYDCGYSTLLHELGHTLGAVQPGAPYATGSGLSNWGHCWEGYDIMCYNDGGNTDPGTIQNNCLDFDHFDCNHDTYFDAKIGVGQGVSAGSWLDTRWNIGECYVAWVVNYACSGGGSADTTRPLAIAPSTQVAAGGQLGTTAVPVRLAWSGSDTGGSGLAGYTLWQSTDGSAFTQVALPSALTTSVVRSLNPAHSYRFVVGSRDGAGNLSEWAYGATFRLNAYQETSAAIAYKGTWTRLAWASAYGGYERTGKAAGATATLAFTGRSVAWVAPTATNRGRAHVYVDGVFVQTLDLYSATTVARKVVFTRNWASAGAHTLKVQIVGTAARPSVDVDAFLVLG